MSELLGQRVLSIGGNDVGEIEEVLLNSGAAAGPTVVVSVGGPLQVGDKLVTAPLSDLKVSNEKESTSTAPRRSSRPSPRSRMGPAG